MKRFMLALLTISAPLMLMQCSRSADTTFNPEPGSPGEVSDGQKKLVESSNDFSLNLFSAITNSQPHGTNIFISPLSVSYALGMALNGADGETYDAMAEVLGTAEMPLSQVNQTYRELTQLLTGLDPRVKMQIANSIWYREKFPVYADFVEANQLYFDALVQELDFSRADAADIINSWVNEKSEGKIKEIVDAPIPFNIVMYLINAVYFKADWTISFAPEITKERLFFAGQESLLTRDFMHTDTVFSYLENDLFQAIDLPYSKKKFSLTVFLPREDYPIDDLISQLNHDSYAAWLSQFEDKKVSLWLPRFKFRYDILLNDALKALGMEIAFDEGNADFGKMAPLDQILGNLYISRVKHKAFIQVDEVGTEAAAVTSIEIAFTSIGNEEEHFFMDVCRPFIVVIREHGSGAILFMGLIFDPVWED